MSASPKLSLYHYVGCPFCDYVRDAAEEIGVELEDRNVLHHPPYRAELYDVMGRGTVPVLRIEHASGEVEWMPESRDIVRYLEREYGSAR